MQSECCATLLALCAAPIREQNVSVCVPQTQVRQEGNAPPAHIAWKGRVALTSSPAAASSLAF
jgi:hypothetical protein